MIQPGVAHGGARQAQTIQAVQTFEIGQSGIADPGAVEKEILKFLHVVEIRQGRIRQLDAGEIQCYGVELIL